MREGSEGLVEAPFVPERFTDRVLAHIYMAGLPELRVPLLLGIQGPSGDGKSYQCRLVAREYGIQLSALSASELAHEFENKPVERLREVYVAAAATVMSTDRPAGLLIDDFDLGIAGVRSGTTYTVNTQLLISFLMNLCDDPLLRGALRRPVGVIITGNDLSVLHGPLRRHGRMSVFKWVPTREERLAIVRTMFSPAVPSVVLEAILTEYPGLPLAFFAHVSGEMKLRLGLEVLKGNQRRLGLDEFERKLRAESIGGATDIGEAVRAVAREVHAAQVVRDYTGQGGAGARPVGRSPGRRRGRLSGRSR